MIKKLYSTNPDGKKKETDNENCKIHYFDLADQLVGAKDKDMQLKKAITERQVFSYGYWRGYCFELFSKWYCCCCRRREKRQEFL